MRKLKLLFLSLSSAVVLLTPALIFAPVHADLFSGAANDACQGANLSDQPCTADIKTAAESNVNKIVGTALNFLSILTGIAAVIIIIISGLRLILSGGDSGSVSSARSGILYAVVGLVVVALAQFIVHYVLQKVNL